MDDEFAQSLLSHLTRECQLSRRICGPNGKITTA